MNNSRRRTRRGVMGIEAAIVMIAFVIVAASLAFVVLNMGFSTTQKAKVAVINSQTEASSALEVAGKVTGVGYAAQGVLNATVIPIKVASGGNNVNLDPTLTTIKYYDNSVRNDDIYGTGCILTSATYNNLTAAFAAAVPGCLSANPTGASATPPTATKAIIFWDVSKTPQNKILVQGDHANVAIGYRSADRPATLDNIKVEIIVPTGSALTVERQVPTITASVVDLG